MELCHFDLGQKSWFRLEKMVVKGEMWKINAQFIERNKAKVFYFTHDPRKGSSFRDGYFKNELYLIEKIKGENYSSFGEGDYVLWKIK